MEKYSLREKNRFDFKIYDRTGIKVPIESTFSGATSLEIISTESKVAGKLSGLMF